MAGTVELDDELEAVGCDLLRADDRARRTRRQVGVRSERAYPTAHETLGLRPGESLGIAGAQRPPSIIVALQ